MGSKTAIQWTDETANVIKVKGPDGKPNGWFCILESPGCTNCYARGINLAGRFGGNGLDYVMPQDGRIPELMLLTDILDGWARRKKPKRIFLNSMTDTFANFVPDEWIFKILDAARNAPSQTIQILTKRARRAYEVTKAWLEARGLVTLPSNIWIGVSVENQRWADQRIPWLLQIPAAVRFLSCEPLLDKVDITHYLPRKYQLNRGETLRYEGTTGIHWVIVGGESGPNARPFRVEWAYSLVEQCQARGVAVFVKQLGAKPWQTGLDTVRRGEWPGRNIHEAGAPGVPGYMVHLRDKKGGEWLEWPADLRVREFPAELVGAA